MDTTTRGQGQDKPEHRRLDSELWLNRLWAVGVRALGTGSRWGPPSQNEGLLRVEVNLLQNYIRLEESLRILAQIRQGRRPHSINVLREIERERQRLGIELHTGVGQLLSATRLQWEIVAAQMSPSPPAVQIALERIATLNAEALEQVRSISRRLRPPEWQVLTLESALRQLWDLSGIPERFEARLRIEPLPQEPELESKTLIYRTAQEAISNITRHSQATRVEGALEIHGDRLVLRFEDNGVGFDVHRFFSGPPSLASGIGLRMIQEQTEAVGGVFQVASGPEGTKIEVGVPFVTPQPNGNSDHVQQGG